MDDQYAFVAAPKKALLDLVHLKPQGDSAAYIASLRLQNLDILNLDRLRHFAARSGKPKLKRAAAQIAEAALHEAEEFDRYESASALTHRRRTTH